MKEQYIMSPSELTTLKEEQQEDEATLRAVEQEGYTKGTRASEILDKTALRRRIDKSKKQIQEYTPKRMSGATKDKLASRAKELASEIKEGMPTANEMDDLRKHPGTPYKNLQWERRNAKKIHEYKQIQRRLEHGDPTASSVERLRKC